MSLEFEIEVHWSDRSPAVIARIATPQARELISQLERLAPGEMARLPDRDQADPARLLFGLQAFYRLVLQRDGCIALAGTDGGLWTIPARVVQGVRVRLVRSEVAVAC